MAISRRLLTVAVGLCVALVLGSSESMTVEAGSNNTYLDSFNSGVAAMLDLNTENAAEIMRATEKELIKTDTENVEESTLVMVNVKSTLNVRAGGRYIRTVAVLFWNVKKDGPRYSQAT